MTRPQLTSRIPGEAGADDHPDPTKVATNGQSANRKGSLPSRPALIALAAVWVAAATWLQLIRGPGYRPLNVIWAEDGGVFLNQAMRHSWWHNLVTPHAGYLQVIGRLLSQPAAWIPLRWDAAWLAASAALTVALLSLAVWYAAGRVLTHQWARALVTVLLPLLPQAGFEVNAAVNDLHWHLAYAAFWLLLAAPTTRRGQALSVLIVVIAALSDPLTGLVLPAAVLGVYRATNRRRALLAPLTMLLALAVQAWVHLTEAVDYRASPTVLADLPKIYALRVVTSAVVGDHLLGSLYRHLGAAVIVAVTLAVAGGLLLLLIRAQRPERVTALAALLVSVAYLCVAVGLRGTSGILDPAPFTLNNSRYTLVPILLLWTALIVLLDACSTRQVQRTWHGSLPGASLIGLVLAGFLGIQLLSDWNEPTTRSGGPAWDTSLAQAAATCRLPINARPPQPAPLVAEESPPFSVPIVPAPDEVTIPVAPTPAPGTPLLFAVVAPCTKLTSPTEPH